MAEVKTKVTRASVVSFIMAIEPLEKRNDSLALLEIFKVATGETPKLWGSSLIGFGQYHYASKRSSQTGDWPLTAFSPRKANLSVYIMPGFKDYGDLMDKLGKYKTSVSCLYIKKLADVDTKVLGKLIRRSMTDMMKRHE